MPKISKLTAEQRSQRARIGGYRRHGSDAAAAELARELRVSRAKDYLRAVIETPPRLRDQDIEELRALLAPAELSTLDGEAA